MNRRAGMLCMSLFLCLFGCRGKAPSGSSSLEVVAPSPNSVPFDAIRTSISPNGTEAWNATYTRNGKRARFNFELSKSQPLSDPSLGFGHGRFLAVAGSDNSELLKELQAVLQAKHSPQQVKRMQTMSFTYADFGTHLSRLPDGGFSLKRPGDWHAIKLFLAGVADKEDDDEVFFNLNPVAQKGEFAIKDPDYGDGVLTQLAKIL